MRTRNFDIAVVGGGLVGAALAYGIAGGEVGAARVVMLDEGDHALRAARGNFGLIWVQGKGAHFPAYARWTLNSARRWPELAHRLHDDTGLDVGLSQRGGLHLCLSEQERVVRTKLVESDGGEGARLEMLDRAALRDVVPDLGPDVVAASFGRDDGHVNPLMLLRALHTGFAHLGGTLVVDAGVRSVSYARGIFTLTGTHTSVQAKRIVLAAGLGNAALAPQVGLVAPITAQRGQIIVLERMPPLLPLPIETLRQTTDGTMLLGDSHEDVASTATSTGVLAAIANHALRALPRLAEARVMRCWAALRVLTSDGMPIYEASASAPGAFVATSHSGVTLAAVHALELAPQFAAGTLDPALTAFSGQRLRASA
ncbi:MAG TPA: FAD-dependent oxidoreductase [Casimicrobiaceae bacterium]|jgi:glycine/D-amino acid oxidase-like deaminating enzyme